MKLPKMPIDVAKYLVSFRHMTLEERGIYIDLLCFQWMNGSIPSDPKQLAKMLGSTITDLGRIWRDMSAYFEASPDGRLINKELDSVRRKAFKLRERLSAGAQKTNVIRRASAQ